MWRGNGAERTPALHKDDCDARPYWIPFPEVKNLKADTWQFDARLRAVDLLNNLSQLVPDRRNKVACVFLVDLVTARLELPSRIFSPSGVLVVVMTDCPMAIKTKWHRVVD